MIDEAHVSECFLQVKNDISEYVYGRTLQMEQRAAMLNKMKINNLATPQGIVDRIHRSSRADVDSIKHFASRFKQNAELEMANEVQGEKTQEDATESDITETTTENINGTSGVSEISKPYVDTLYVA